MGWFFCFKLIDNKCKYKTCWSKWVNCKVFLLCTLLWVISHIGFPHSSFIDILSDNYDNHQTIAMSLWFTPQISTKFWKTNKKNLMTSNFDYQFSYGWSLAKVSQFMNHMLFLLCFINFEKLILFFFQIFMNHSKLYILDCLICQ